MDRKKQLQKEEEEVKDKAERPKDYRPFVQQDEAKPDFHDSADFMTIDQREAMRELDDSQLVGPPPPLSLPLHPPPATATATASTSTSTSTALVVTRDVHVADAHVSTAGTLPSANRKRGRPPKARGKTGPSPPPPQRKQVAVVDEDEDVCFICFDGGSLVLCDRRGCPKAYHPTCIKRDEAFFRSTAKWNCGWHICSSCQKSSYYMCYTCTYSLCKGCTKGADYVCVRDNKGFCGICMKTILLIENVTMGNVDQQIQVDFDDKTSWEYLFKVYWVYLKDKESLTIEELTNAKNPWKGDELPKARNSWKRNGYVARKEILTGEHFYADNEKVSCLDSCSGNGEETLSKRRKTNDQSDQTEKKSFVMEKPTVQKAIPLPEGTTWATKALLEFVAHMKNGDQSMQSPSDVLDLLLEYIKRNNLRDPLQKAEVVCDARLTNLFRRPRVGHLEMLKLIEYHFLTKEKSPPDHNVRMTVADDLSRQLEGASCSDSQLAMVNGGQHITNKKANEKGSPINPNADEYAAVDAHNINLLYLKCNLIEKLLDDTENFREKVVGSFVRIRVAVGDKKQDVYRLVQVVGICKADEPYKVGSRTTNMKLEILNLGKKEVISIDGICDQDFSEDECRRLRETVKCGLIKPLKVGEIQEKAMVLQPVKVSDCLEAEMLRLNNLRDRASEKGLRKDFRESVEKLELLKSPNEQERRLLEIPNVHMDQEMDPTYASEEDAKDRYDNKQGDDVRINNASTARKGIELNSSPGEDDLNDIGHRALKTLAAASEQVEMNSRVDLEGTLHIQERGNDSLWSRGTVACRLSIPNTSKNQLSDAGSETVKRSSPAPVTIESVPVVASSVIPPSLSSGNKMHVSDFETENLWNYQDPSGKIQGPFSLVQLRKWSEMKNIFPDDFRVWKINEKQQNSILLTDALIGRFPKEPLQPHALTEEATVSYKNADEKQEHRHGQGTDVAWEDNKRADHDQKPLQNDAQIHGNRNDEHAKSGLDSHSISLIRAADAAVSDDTQARASLQVWEFPEGTKSSVSLPAPSSSGKSNEEGSSNPGNVDMDSLGTARQTNAKDNVEKQAEIDTHSSQSTGENWRPQSMNSSTNGWDSNTGFLSVVKSIEKSEHIQKFDFSNMATTEPVQANENLKNQVAEKSGPPSWSTGSSLVIGGRQVPEAAVDWLSFSSAPAERSVEQWDINLVSSSSLKPSEGTPTSGMDQLTLSSSSHPTIGVPSWHPMVPEPNEFCSLVDESVSDLLAEVEAMESLGGLPSPTSKLRYDLELTPGSDDDCFSPVERFSHPPDQGKSDALSSTSDIQIPCQLSAVEESLRLSLMPSQPTITIEPLAVSQMPSHLAQIQQQGIIQNQPLRASQIAPQSTLTEEPVRVWKSDPIDPLRSFNGHSSSAKVNGSEVSVNQWDIRLDIQPLESSAKQRQAGSDISAPLATVDASRRMDKGKPNLNRVGVAQGNANKRGSSHGITQHSTNSVVSSTGNQGQSRHGSESRNSGQRDRRNHSHNNRDSGSGRDRSSWNRQAAYGSAGNVGGSFKGPSKGQRVCKFYESGCCKRGASCSYWHP